LKKSILQGGTNSRKQFFLTQRHKNKSGEKKRDPQKNTKIEKTESEIVVAFFNVKFKAISFL